MSIEQTAIVLIDVQGRLAQIMSESDRTIQKIEQLVQGGKALNIPIIWLEQYPRGLGPTVQSIADLLPDQKPIEKLTFSAWQNDEFKKSLLASNKKNVLLCGIETHICCYQTAKDLQKAGFHVQVVADAVDSRTALNNTIGLKRMEQEGVLLTSVEMVLFELIQTAESEHFKRISKIIQ